MYYNTSCRLQKHYNKYKMELQEKKNFIYRQEMTDMDKLDQEYGQLKIRLSELIAEKGLNRNQVSIKAAMNWKQVNRYCDNDISRLDIFVLCKLCTALECNIQDLLLFIPANSKSDR